MKRWLIFVAVALAGIIAVFLILRKPAGGPGMGGPGLLEYAPAQSTAIVYLDLERFRESQFWARVLPLIPDVRPDAEYARFVQATGFDYARDLRRVAVAFTPEGNGVKGVAFAEGRFDRAKIEKYLRAQNLVREHDGATVYFTGDAHGPAFVFLSDDVIAASEFRPDNPSYLAAMANARRREGLPAELRQRVERVSAAPFFAAGRVAEAAPQAGASRPANTVEDQAREILKHVRWYGIAAQPEGEQLRLVLEGECENVLRAGQLSVLLNSAHFVARQALKDPKTRRQIPPAQLALLEGLLDSAKISREGTRARVMLEISANALQ